MSPRFVPDALVNVIWFKAPSAVNTFEEVATVNNADGVDVPTPTLPVLETTNIGDEVAINNR